MRRTVPRRRQRRHARTKKGLVPRVAAVNQRLMTVVERVRVNKACASGELRRACPALRRSNAPVRTGRIMCANGAHDASVRLANRAWVRTGTSRHPWQSAAGSFAIPAFDGVSALTQQDPPPRSTRMSPDASTHSVRLGRNTEHKASERIASFFILLSFRDFGVYTGPWAKSRRLHRGDDCG